MIMVMFMFLMLLHTYSNPYFIIQISIIITIEVSLIFCVALNGEINSMLTTYRTPIIVSNSPDTY
jgi:hypothetical protein